MLDIVEKFMRIVFTIVLGGVVALAGLKVQWDRVGIEADKTCFGEFDRIQKILQAEEVISKALVQRYASRCEISLQQAGEELNSSKAAIEMASADQPGRVLPLATEEPGGETALVPGGIGAPGDPAADGFAAIGRVQTDVYAQVNFDRSDSTPATGNGSAPSVGDKLRARWEVNLRTNTELTTGGQNPVVGLVTTGQCVEVTGTPEERRGQFWAPVKKVEC
ncbi:MAG: hypothetical protein ACKO1H_11570 [Tabrizicola sp.]